MPTRKSFNIPCHWTRTCWSKSWQVFGQLSVNIFLWYLSDATLPISFIRPWGKTQEHESITYFL